MKTIVYLDTNLWNRLLDQQINPEHLLNELNMRNAILALSGHTVYELAKTFLSSPERAQRLFQYLKRYIDTGIVMVHDNMNQLEAELSAMHEGSSSVIAFYGAREYSKLQAEVDKLAQGVFDKEAQDFIMERQKFASSSRSDQKSHFDTKQDVKNTLKTVPENQLQVWLQKELTSENGAAMLTRHLQRIYPTTDVDTLIGAALTLLGIPASRIAKGIVRADLYFNWRCANRESNPKDLVDDMYHVLNASYCAIYATAEASQVQYATLLLHSSTQIAVYDDKIPIDEWLLTLV